MNSKSGFGTALLHADDHGSNKDSAVDGGSVAPSISVSTTFRHTEGDYLTNWDAADPSRHVYSRYSTPTQLRAEKVLSQILNGYALTYSSGLAGCCAAIAYYQPKRIAITKGYMGTHGVLDIFKRSISNMTMIDLDDDYRPGDLAWVETPLNPTGEARNIRKYADKIHAVGGKLVVDSTFGPPPLQDAFRFGADCVFHSGTKYFGGHSDLLCGVLVVKDLEVWRQLHHDRVHLGSMMGSLETWLLLRSLRTLHLRVPRQSETATSLVQWLLRVSETPKGKTWDGVPGGLIHTVYHSSLQQDKVDFDVKAQMPGGFSPTFAILLADPSHAERLPFAVRIFTAATSLGGVESLMEQRRMADPDEDERLVRLSVGLEDLEDLREDLRQALRSLTSTTCSKFKQEKAKL
ncbi:hypothetical protein FRB94_007020 [Tulasnella sp. JGI-2019a]|nr:hypothetical protein FRB94_007020 [Tulasnella sp. JGI-2019a]KAG9016933.1 hypothetical protein FRB93_009463 [Tulasnella sp. JGI-2019a]